MYDIGKILQQARKKKNYTLEKVHKTTKIKESYIIGLESSDVSSFPAELYYKNFLKTYSKYLGLDPNEILKFYEENKLEKEQDLFREDFKIEQTADNFKYKLIITIVLSVMLFVVLFLLISKNINNNSNTQTLPAVQEPAKAEEPIKNVDSEKTKQTLVIEATKNTWIKIDSDNKTIYEEILYSGEKYEASANDIFVIKIGNVTNVDVYFNDKKVDILTGASINKVNTITLKKS